ncbi:MAG TPA: hypothetical protein VKF82_12690 [Candidatus Eremiobacteraceae bacterium]|nr:hypothetical protein [Candidatus Eremiobacteraceae bacterium]
MSFSRLAALGLALLAGVTLASCASSSAPLPATGPNPQTFTFPGGAARIEFIQGSPNLNLTVTNTDLYIDNKLAFPNFSYPYALPNPANSGPVIVGPVTPFIALPIGAHDFKLVQHGTLSPAFLDATITLKAGQKIALVAEGDAAYHTTQWAEWLLPVYATPAGIRATSVFNASPNARANVDVWYNCNAPALCGDGTHSGTKLASALVLGTAAAPAASWANNVVLKSSTTGSYCLATYPAGGAGPPLTALNVAAGPPYANIPQVGPAANDPQNAACLAGQSVAIGPGTDTDFFVIDAPSVAPLVPANGPSAMLQVPDQNG